MNRAKWGFSFLLFAASILVMSCSRLATSEVSGLETSSTPRNTAKTETWTATAECSGTSFAFEEDFECQRVLPTLVWKQILESVDESVRPQLHSASNPSDWVEGAIVKFQGGGNGFIVKATKFPLRGVNITRFWLFTSTAGAYHLALDVTASQIIVKPDNSLDVVRASATKIDTTSYRLDSQSGVFVEQGSK